MGSVLSLERTSKTGVKQKIHKAELFMNKIIHLLYNILKASFPAIVVYDTHIAAPVLSRYHLLCHISMATQKYYFRLSLWNEIK